MGQEPAAPQEPESLRKARTNLEVCKAQLGDPDTSLAVVMHGVMIAVGDAMVAQAEIMLRMQDHAARTAVAIEALVARLNEDEKDGDG